ncbi:MAG: response regulator, partial [Planctomycetota bacterium]
IVQRSLTLGRQIDLAVLDMHMPEATGLEVLESIVEQALAIPCILCSGQAGDDVLRMAQSRGAHAVFRKPVEPLVLRNEVLRALGLDGQASTN